MCHTINRRQGLALGRHQGHTIDMTKTDERVLHFFVSGALLVGSAACSKSNSEETINDGPMDENPVEKNVNVLPKESPDTVRVPVGIPDRVNTNHIGPNGENLNRQGGHPAPPVAMPKDSVEEDRVNTNHIDPNSVNATPPVPAKEPVIHKTNTGRQVEPVPPKARPQRPDRTNTNRQIEPGPPPVTKP